MDNFLNTVTDYFQPPGNYFWRWAEDGQVIEWQDGDTICYREELLDILKKLSREGLPSIGAILLVISACRDKRADIDKEGGSTIVLRLMNYYGKNTSILMGMRERVIEATRILHLVSALPEELRSGSNRTWMLYTIFKGVRKKITPNVAAGCIDYFNQGSLDKYIFREGNSDNKARVFNDDMQLLNQAKQLIPTVQHLEMLIRTGTGDLPQAAALEVPHLETGELLEQLEEDVKTTGLAQLTKRLIAALNIPIHTHGSGDQLFGGVSDITNRGNFDRLLLSELAHDDLSLMARLANNEALYLRREELPSNPEKQRIVLVDTTLKMWGLPRVFAVSAALACTLNNKAKAQITSYALSGTAFNETDLATKEGVVRSLEQLDAALHCGRGLSQFMDQQAVGENDEVFLITEEEITHSVLFQSILASLKKPVNFLVTVTRDGELRFYEYIRGRKKQLSEARFDLQELLFNIRKPKKEKYNNKTRDLLNAPAFMQYQPSPLYYPASKIRFFTDCIFEVKKDHLICVTHDQRVLYWTSNKKGAREIIESLESGLVRFGSAGDATVYMLVYPVGQKHMWLYEVNLETGTVETKKLLKGISGYAETVFENGYFNIRADNELFVIEAATGKISPAKEPPGVFDLMVERSKKALENINLNTYKRFVNNGYNTINTVKRVYVTADGEIGFDEKLITLRAQGQSINICKVRKSINPDYGAKESEASIIGITSTNIKFSRFVWADGSEAVVDSRGLIHLRSADRSIPEITIVMIMDKPTACWSADERVCGAAYFIGEPTGQSHDGVAWFYKNHIQRFTDRIKETCTLR
ncbi:hypothetical protein A4H97_05120 [Niastella yeongjuensis]|uniref:Uncharacterized protein n=1 Tax=Niastella yeongjuensis TaxID=354355 RepID=A0A1V9EL84_9BACT|nr:hypothetical protein [Niastella yeongjuensis]OQP46903.1 hypothetical protein A4H97_05120 [Niastella yeongjuensis]SEN59716.1 hypothetical protein SAMN05660816_01047 [Niastella yeongjuensis]